jgi:undecaprenyl-diphosphatase
MTIIQAIILSIVEGLTEFLPISSTAHLVLVSKILKISQTDFVKSFEIIVQLGAILAVIVMYFKELVTNYRLWYKVILAFLPSVFVGFFLFDLIKDRLIGNGLITAVMLVVGGLVFIFIDKIITFKNTYLVTIDTLRSKQLLSIGLFQCVAMVPGVSRAAASIFGGLIVGLNKNEATKFSFFLAVPTMLAATTLDLFKSSVVFTQHDMLLLSVGLAGSFFTALLAIKSLIKFVQKHTFLPFGVYRIVIGLLWLFSFKLIF